jgi:hypothetical protein
VGWTTQGAFRSVLPGPRPPCCLIFFISNQLSCRASFVRYPARGRASCSCSCLLASRTIRAECERPLLPCMLRRSLLEDVRLPAAAGGAAGGGDVVVRRPAAAASSSAGHQAARAALARLGQHPPGAARGQGGAAARALGAAYHAPGWSWTTRYVFFSLFMHARYTTDSPTDRARLSLWHRGYRVSAPGT